jgi:protein TonB
MFNPLQPATKPNRWLAISLAAHALLFTALLIHPPIKLQKTQRPGTHAGHLALLTYRPGASTLASTSTASPHPETIKTAPPRTPPATEAKLTLPTKTAPAATTSAADDAAGDGDITLALVDNHPAPQPTLPSNTHGDVIIDITIGPDGHLAQSTLIHGLGHPVDDTVLATIQSWTWHPATRNGTPIASEQELLFHYDHA